MPRYANKAHVSVKKHEYVKGANKKTKTTNYDRKILTTINDFPGNDRADLKLRK